MLLGLLLPAVQAVRGAASRASCANNLHQIGLALHAYHDSRGAFPPGMQSPESGDQYAWLSWQARLLPYLEQGPLWDSVGPAYRASRSPFRDPPHIALATVVPVYACPADTRAFSVQETYGGQRVALTSYLGVEGADYEHPSGVLFRDSHVAFNDITDGTSNTVVVGERPASVDFWFGWWYAGLGQGQTGSADMVLGVRELNMGGNYTTDCPPGPYHFTPGDLRRHSDLFHFWSLHQGGAYFLFADASVRFLSYSADEILPALATRSGGEVIEPP